MKRLGVSVLTVVLAAFLLGPLALADSKDDLQAIKKAVKENPNYEAGKDVKWFKVLVTDNRTNKEKVRITLPISVVEIFMRCMDDKQMKIKEGDCDIDLKAVFKELRAMGPMALIEVYEEDETVKIWLE